MRPARAPDRLSRQTPAPAGATDWPRWQQEVLAELRRDLAEVLPEISADEVHWEAWRSLYEKGCGARAAVDRAFARV